MLTSRTSLTHYPESVDTLATLTITTALLTHSVYVSYAVPPEDAWPALLHDATEAYTNDISKPLKDLLPDFQALEKRLEAVVLPALGVHHMPASVKMADNAILLPEMRDQMGLGIQDSHPPIVGWDWLTAKQIFLRRYRQLKWMQS